MKPIALLLAVICISGCCEKPKPGTWTTDEVRGFSQEVAKSTFRLGARTASLVLATNTDAFFDRQQLYEQTSNLVTNADPFLWYVK